MKVLTKLRIDEISCVDHAANGGAKVVLMKRDDSDDRKPYKVFGYEMPKTSIYHEIFARKDDVRKSAPRYRGVSGRKIHRVENLSRSEAKQFLLHDPAGRALLRETGGDIDALADHLVEASQRTTNKRREEPKMDINKIDKTLREVGEHGFTKMIEKYAATVRQPNETKEQAFVRVFTADSEEGQALRKCWQVSKGVPVAEPDEEDTADEQEADKDREEDEDALKELERLAAEEQRRNAGMSKAVAFAKVYSDPANAALAQRERRQNRPRA